MKKILIIEPFYGGSHKKLIDTITEALDPNYITLVTMKAKKWPWRARCSSLYMYQNIPNLEDFGTLFCSSVLSLAELIGMCPDLVKLKKIVYFHENQLVYPVQTIKKRDYQYGFNQITTCVAADTIIFNSKYNMDSFLENIPRFIKIMPDYKPKNIAEILKKKMLVLYFPINFSTIDNVRINMNQDIETNINKPVHIVWPHRWEFDKNPKLLFITLYRLKADNVNFKVSILGESFNEVPEEFLDVRENLKNYINHMGYVESVDKFYEILLNADIVVSTANHEFFGVSMLEAVKCGCIPLAPNRLVYPEIYPKEYLYNTDEELFTILKNWCIDLNLLNEMKKSFFIDFEKFGTTCLLPKFLSFFDNN